MKKTLFLALMTFVLIVSFTVVISGANLIDQEFASTTGGDLKWAYFETAGTLEYNNTQYSAATLVIYGDGTSYEFSQDIGYNN